MAPKLVACMRWGDRYGVRYVNRLFWAVRRNVSGPVDFVCFTDDASGLDPRIDARALPPFEASEAMLWTAWRKISLWGPQMPPDLQGRDALFLDLDVVVTGSLDPLFTYAPLGYEAGWPVLIENWTQHGLGIGNTSVVRFRVGALRTIYETFADTPEARLLATYRSEQAFVSAFGRPFVYWPMAWVRSFKEELVPSWPQRFVQAPVLPEGTRIVVFHGRPDIHEAERGEWPGSRWKRLYKHVRPSQWIGTHWRDEPPGPVGPPLLGW